MAWKLEEKGEKGALFLLGEKADVTRQTPPNPPDLQGFRKKFLIVEGNQLWQLTEK